MPRCGKHAYRTACEAWRAVRARRRLAPLTIYRCPVCHAWHLKTCIDRIACVQRGGKWHSPDELPGYLDRRGAFRSTLASTLLRAVLGRVGFDYLTAHPPVDTDYPYHLRAALSYCDTRLHRGTIYRAAGFGLARVNERGIETWWTPTVAPLTAEQDAEVRRLAERSPRSKRIRAERAQLVMEL